LIFTHPFREKRLDQTLSWASNLTTISDNDILIIKHARKSLLFNTGKPWIKKTVKVCLTLLLAAMMAQKYVN
jgi:hypothetical protein